MQVERVDSRSWIPGAAQHSKEEQHNIRVAVRVRPLSQLEKELKNESIWQTSGPYASHDTL
jgi:hypothetical protein